MEPGYQVTAAPDSKNSLCDAVTAEAPQQLLGKSRYEVNASGVVAWGDPTIVMRCGVKPLKPTTDTCMNVNGIDWVLDEARAKDGGERVVTTYGRNPAIEVTFLSDSQSAGDALVSLDKAARAIPQTSKCI
ncbi:DUF3515 family protein [Streptomyces sp. NPDC018019]|uniref:DUF3515 family protein n=1 Tax=Streptomyces sp. NPDC018019 TaxID=3365030 RepID=UPI0037B8DA67